MSKPVSNRFSALFEDKDYKNYKNNNNKCVKKQNNDVKKQEMKEDKKRVYLEEKKKEEEKNCLDMKYFPELKSVKPVKPIEEVKEVKEEEVKVITMTDMLLKPKEIVEEVIVPVIPAGWVYFQKNLKTIKYEYGADVIDLNNVGSNIVEPYERRVKRYIEDWGEEDYAKTFLFSNYDYDYFDNLDYEYELEETMEDVNELLLVN
jgi:hypothetical protein